MIKKMCLVALLFLSLNVQSRPVNILCKIVTVFDGDTVTCLVSQKTRHKIRLANIDAPESHQAYGNKSKQMLLKLIGGKHVQVKLQGKDRYQRDIGVIYYRSKNINLQMVKAGMAWVYPRYAKEKRYFTAQAEAKKRRIGLWADPRAISPWEFRQRQRHQK